MDIEPGHDQTGRPDDKAAVRLLLSIIGLVVVGRLLVAVEKEFLVQLQSLVRPLADSLLVYNDGPLAGLFVGLLLSSVLQSSSVSLRFLIHAGAANGPQLVWGANLGTTVTATLSALSFCWSKERFGRAALAASLHFGVNLFGVIGLALLEWLVEGQSRSARVFAAWFTRHFGIVASETSDSSSSWPEINIVWLFVCAVALLIILVRCVLYIWAEGEKAWSRSPLAERLAYWVETVAAGVIPFRFDTRGVYSLGVVVVGIVATAAVSSSSIVTVIIVVLAAVNRLSESAVYLLILGANAGTTVSVMFEGVQSGNQGVELAFAHVMFNIITVMAIGSTYRWGQVPMKFARWVGRSAAKSRTLAILAVFALFYGIPSFVLLILRARVVAYGP